MAWTPKILSEFELGLAAAAIEEVARLDKPLAEVGCRDGNRDDIEHDLKQCLNGRPQEEQISVWIRQRGERWAFGFYRAPWVMRAMDYLERADVEPSDRHWISGLLFGYRASAIQTFIEAFPRVVSADAAQAAAEQTSSSRPSRSSNTAQISPLREILRAGGS